ncbi:hypothetical protein QUB80_24480 [Chlorogloeopsis sp. ULAP01]|uniref:hypothetical protein n=1 Tax=Chlorogloeopsis sp. ULAP01 TaxID=3056483 RepID=UPI0025AA3258|nr:hypothetical protein [Chlorogloeopsis sp. ULAP01]MDM9383846.1 hypothetical protein [Chlorogloeopsis sp. ULAP01]
MTAKKRSRIFSKPQQHTRDHTDPCCLCGSKIQNRITRVTIKNPIAMTGFVIKAITVF